MRMTKMRKIGSNNKCNDDRNNNNKNNDNKITRTMRTWDEDTTIKKRTRTMRNDDDEG